MTIAELIAQLSQLDPTTRVAVWRPSTARGNADDFVRLAGGTFPERIALTAQADPTSDNYPLWDDREHSGADMAPVVIIS